MRRAEILVLFAKQQHVYRDVVVLGKYVLESVELGGIESGDIAPTAVSGKRSGQIPDFGVICTGDGNFDQWLAIGYRIGEIGNIAEVVDAVPQTILDNPEVDAIKRDGGCIAGTDSRIDI